MAECLTSTIIADTYVSLLKTCDNSQLTTSNTIITDGCGNVTSLHLGCANSSSCFNGSLNVNGIFSTTGGDNLTYPSVDGNNNDFLITDGSGGLTFSSLNTVLSSTSLSGTIVDNNATYTSISAIKVDRVGRVNEVVTSTCANRPHFSGLLTPVEKFTGSAGSVTYCLDSSFTGNVSANYEPTKVIGVYVHGFTFGTGPFNSKICATLPNGTTHIIQSTYGDNGDDDGGSSNIINLPINPGQNEFTLTSNCDFRTDDNSCRGWRITGFQLIG